MEKYTFEFTPGDRPILFTLVYSDVLDKWAIWQQDVIAGKDYYTKELLTNNNEQAILEDIKYKFSVNTSNKLTTFEFCYKRESDDWIIWRRDNFEDKNVLSGFYGFPPT